MKCFDIFYQLLLCLVRYVVTVVLVVIPYILMGTLVRTKYVMMIINN